MAAAGALPWLVQLLFDLLLVGYVVHLRRKARLLGATGVGQRAAVAVPTAEPGGASADRPAWSIPQRPSRQAGYRRVAAPRRAPAAATTSPLPAVADPVLTDPAEETWDPVPVPPPSYVASAAADDYESAVTAAEVSSDHPPVADEEAGITAAAGSPAPGSDAGSGPAGRERQRGLLEELGLWDEDDLEDPVDRAVRRRAVGED